MNFTSFFFPFLMQLPDNSKSHMWLTFMACKKFLFNSTTLNSRDGGAWWFAICGVAQSRTRLKRCSSSSNSSLNSISSSRVLLDSLLGIPFSATCRTVSPHLAACKPSGEQAQLPSYLQPSESLLAKPRAGHKQQLSWFSLDELKCNQGRHGEAGRTAPEVHPGPKAPEVQAAEATS